METKEKKSLRIKLVKILLKNYCLNNLFNPIRENDLIDLLLHTFSFNCNVTNYKLTGVGFTTNITVTKENGELYTLNMKLIRDVFFECNIS